MEYSNNNNAVSIDHEEDLIGELSRECATGGLIDDWLRLRITNDRIEKTVNRADEL